MSVPDWSVMPSAVGGSVSLPSVTMNSSSHSEKAVTRAMSKTVRPPESKSGRESPDSTDVSCPTVSP